MYIYMYIYVYIYIYTHIYTHTHMYTYKHIQHYLVRPDVQRPRHLGFGAVVWSLRFSGYTIPCRMLGVTLDTTPCRMTEVTLHGIVSLAVWCFGCRVSWFGFGVKGSGVVSPEVWCFGLGVLWFGWVWG